jgi:hypothetical protein
MTEMQMLFVKSDFSKDPSINGIWPWGAGVFELNVPLYQLAGDSWPLYLDKLSIWNETKTEIDAVLLVSVAQANNIVNQVTNSVWKKQPIRFWWKNGYQDIRPMSVWDKIKSWIKK